ncbi:MAG TPA: NAD-dependent deacylase [Armatimonadota bacterium]|jgi:NAD-dependent deacetylase
MQPDFERQVQELADLLRHSQRTVVLTGAGISTESGIPDFRTPGSGLWSKVDPMEILSVTAMHTDPKRFYDFKIPLWRTFNAAQPNAGHIALAELESMGRVRCVVTQNIDSLHTRAGSQNVLEVHGHMRTGRCMRCHEHVPFEILAERVEGGQVPPKCDCGGILRPDVVLFEDMLPEAFQDAVREAMSCDLLLVIGSSLEVSPANTLADYPAKLAILNVGPTVYDRRADWLCRAKAGEFLPKVVEALR